MRFQASIPLPFPVPVSTPVSDRLLLLVRRGTTTTPSDKALEGANAVVEKAVSILELGVVLVGVGSSLAVKVSLKEKEILVSN